MGIKKHFTRLFYLKDASGLVFIAKATRCKIWSDYIEV